MCCWPQNRRNPCHGTLDRSQTTDPADALGRFLRALVFNFLIGGTDAHAKNFSLIHLPGRKSFMAPLYDLISYDPYLDDEVEFRSLKMVMKIKHYEFENVMPRHWEALSGLFRTNPEQIIAVIKEFACAIPDGMASVRDQCLAEGLDHPILNTMVDRLAQRCERIIRIYKFGTCPTPHSWMPPPRRSPHSIH
jgi:serine/threonine-protein kinase HipA